MIGRVISTKLAHTATVLVERVTRHPLYKKTFRRSKKYLVDDWLEVKDGDIVEIVKCKPVSQNKHFKITKVLGRNFAEIAESQLKKAAAAVIAEVMPEPSSAEASEGKEKKEKIKPKTKKKGESS